MMTMWILLIVGISVGFLALMLWTGGRSDSWRIAESERNQKERAKVNQLKL